MNIGDSAPRPFTVPDLLLERFLVDDVSDDERAHVLAALESDARLGAWLDERRASQQAFDLAPPAFKDPPRARASSIRVLPLAAALACAALFFVVHKPDDDVVRGRGGALPLEVAVRRDAHVFPLGAALLRPNDAVRITVHAPDAGFATAVLVDERGGFDVLYEAIKVSRGASPLPGSLVLDDAAGRERLYVAWSRAPLAPTRVIAAIKRAEEAGATPEIGDALGVVEWQKEPEP